MVGCTTRDVFASAGAGLELRSQILQRCLLVICWAGCWLLSACPSFVWAQALHLPQEILPEAQLAGLDSQGRWVFQVGAAADGHMSQLGKRGSSADLDERRLRWDQFVRWGGWRLNTSSPSVWLDDGTWLCGQLQFDEGVAIVESAAFEAIRIPMPQVRGIVFTPYANPYAMNQLIGEMRSATGDRDVIWLVDGRKVTGVMRMEASLQAQGGLKIFLKGVKQDAELLPSDIRAVAISPTLHPRLDSFPQSPILGLLDGCRLNVRQQAIVGKRVEIETVGGLKVITRGDSNDLAGEVIFLAGQPAEVQRLAGVTPASYKHIGDSLLQWPLGRDEDLLHRPLAGPDGNTSSGLAMHSLSQVAYRWDGTPGKLLAELCLAKPVGSANSFGGSLTCEVLVARSAGLEKIGEYQLVRNADEGASASVGPTTLLELDITGAKLIVLVARPGSLGEYGDHVLWLDARLVSVTANEAGR